MCEGGREGCGGGECVRVREREGYPLHCCVTGNLIERGREAGRQQGRGERERERGRSDAMQKHRARAAVVGITEEGDRLWTLQDPHCRVWSCWWGVK